MNYMTWNLSHFKNQYIHGQRDNSLVEECRGKNDNISELVYVGDGETQALIACVEQRDDECIEEEEELMEEED